MTPIKILESHRTRRNAKWNEIYAPGGVEVEFSIPEKVSNFSFQLKNEKKKIPPRSFFINSKYKSVLWRFFKQFELSVLK